MKALLVGTVLALSLTGIVFAQDVPASPSPSPSPTATPRFELHATGSHVFIDQSTGGPGQTPPEGAAFANGAPAAPMTPYDWFSANPLEPGVAGEVQYRATATLHAKRVSYDLTAMGALVAGDQINAVYWGEPLLGAFDPMEGRSPLSLPVAFPTHAGANDIGVAEFVVPYSGTIRSNDGHWRVSGGFVDTTQYDSFVFVQPAFASFNPSMNVQTFETLGPGLSDLHSWTHLAQALPLLGIDAYDTVGALRVEATDALLPIYQGATARVTGANVVWDRGDAGRYSADVAHVRTGGAPIVIPSLFGANPTTNPGPQGPLALATIGNQSQTVAGVRGYFHPHRGYDATIEFGRSWYDASLVARPGTATAGTFEHLALARNFNSTDNAGIDYYRMDPRYGTAYIPYGTSLNVWGTAWAYPGPWLKGSYQLVNDAWGGTNRVGVRAHGTIVRGPWTLSAAAYDYRQVEPSTYANLTQTGFVEVDYLVLAPGDIEYGHTRGVDAYVAWQHARDTLSLDFANDAQYRDHAAFAPVDTVDMRYPQLVAAEQHRFSRSLLASVGYGRYGLNGTWTTTAVDATYGLGFAGLEWDMGRFGQLLVQVRRYGVVGIPTVPGGPPLTFRGTGITVDHHFSI